MSEPVLTQDLIAEAIGYLDLILDEHASGFIHLDRAELIVRLDKIRADAMSCRIILAERRSLHLE